MGAGDEVGLAYDDEADLRRAERIRELQKEIDTAAAVVGGLSVRDDPGQYAAAVHQAVGELAATLAGRRFGSLQADALALRTLVLDGGAAVAEAELSAMEGELASLESRSAGAVSEVTAPAGGLFTASPDGYESLSPDGLEDLTPAKLREWLEKKPALPARAFGRLVTGDTWYFAALCGADEAAELRTGDTVTLDLQELCGVSPRLTVRFVGPAEDGESAVLLSCDTCLRETLSLRFADAEAVTESLSGLRVPREALREENGQTVVYRVSGLLAERVPVSVLWEGEYALVASETPLEGSEIILGGKDLYDGKILK